jgi:predicted Zn-dependent peptidase
MTKPEPYKLGDIVGWVKDDLIIKESIKNGESKKVVVERAIILTSQRINRKIKSSCKFFLKFWDDPDTLLQEYEKYGLKVEDRIEIENFIEKMKSMVWT